MSASMVLWAYWWRSHLSTSMCSASIQEAIVWNLLFTTVENRQQNFYLWKLLSWQFPILHDSRYTFLAQQLWVDAFTSYCMLRELSPKCAYSLLNAFVESNQIQFLWILFYVNPNFTNIYNTCAKKNAQNYSVDGSLCDW